MGEIIAGKKIAMNLREEIKRFTELRKSNGLNVPCLATIIVGEDPGSLYYVNNQSKLCQELGIDTKVIKLSEDISEKSLINQIEELNEDNGIHGVMIQLPLPKHLNEINITSRINYKKDVDGLTDINNGKFYKGEKCFIPCTPNSVVHLIKNTGVSIEGKNVVVLGRSNIVGKPAAQLLINENATVTICHSKTQNLKAVCKNADILVVAIGKPKFVTKDYVKEGAIVIDVGTSSLEGKICGDVCFDEVIDIASYVTPVPGGVGAMTTTLLLKNVCEALINNEH